MVSVTWMWSQWPHILRYYHCDTPCRAMLFKGGLQLPKMVEYPPLALSLTQAHLCGTPFATYRTIIVRFPTKTNTKKFCDTIATSIARYKKYRCWASKNVVFLHRVGKAPMGTNKNTMGKKQRITYSQNQASQGFREGGSCDVRKGKRQPPPPRFWIALETTPFTTESHVRWLRHCEGPKSPDNPYPLN